MTSESFVFENVLDDQNDKNLIDFECDLQTSPAEQFTCTKCNKAFKTEYSLGQHVKMVHKTVKRKRENLISLLRSQRNKMS